MGLVKVFVFCCVLCFMGQVALADEKMQESREISHRAAENNEESPAPRHPDSHEAMNNRESPVAEVRQKRSYEFLVGLINNNSRYEVTRVDPGLTTQKPRIVSEDVTASEILLELMVRIAAHPDQWNRVHTILKSIDEDLTTSKNVIKKLQEKQLQAPPKLYRTDEKNATNAHLTQRNDSIVNTGKTDKSDKPITVDSTWPTFDVENSEGVVNKIITREDDVKNSKLGLSHKPNKSTYPKNFAYHRVTGKPIDLDISPKAYIAVSVIAPKPSNPQSKEDAMALEDELHQLKPWTHRDHLQKMASIRSRWVIGEKGGKKS